MKKTLALLGALSLATPGAAEEQLLDGIAAQVGPDVVLLSEVTGLSADMEARLREMGASDRDIAQVQADILESLIERRLIEQMVRRTEITASDAEVNDTIRQIALENGLTSEQLMQSVEVNGLSFQDYRERIRDEIQRVKVVNAMVRSRVRVEEAQVRALYAQRYADQPTGGEEVHLRHLLLTFGREVGRDEATACGSVRAARERIAAGEPFERLAAEISEANPESGGDVGWVHTSTLAGWMAPVVANLEPGQTSDVLRMPFGCNLLHLVERRAFEKPSYEDVRQALEAELHEQAFQREYADWMEKLRAQTYIERKGLFADAARIVSSPSSRGTQTP